MHYHPLLDFTHCKWFKTEVPDDMSLDDFHEYVAEKVQKDKQVFKLVERGTVKNTDLETNSQKTLKNSSIEHNSYVWAMEK